MSQDAPDPCGGHPAGGPCTAADLSDPTVEALTSGEAGTRAIRGGAGRLIAFACATLCSVISSAVLYRHLGVVRTGHYVTITSLVALCAGLTDAGLATVGLREMANQTKEQRAALMPDLSGLRLTLASLGALVAIGFAAVAGYGGVLVIGTTIASVGGVLLTLEDTWAIPLTAELRVTPVALADLLRVFLIALGIVVLSVAGGGLLIFFAVSIPAAASAALINGWLIRQDVPLRPRLRRSVAVRLLRDTLTFSLAAAVISVYFRISLILVSVIASPTQTGYFSASMRVIEVLLTVPAMLVGITFPIFARAAETDRERLDLAIGRVFDTLWLVGLAMALVLVVGAPFIISVIAGAKFHGSVAVLRIQGLALVSSSVGSVWSYTLLSLHRHRAILVASFSALLLCGALSGTLAAISGARGAAIGTTVAETAFVLMLGVAVHRSGVRPKVHWRTLPRSVIAVGIGLLPMLLSGSPDVVRLAISLILYVAALLMLRAVPDEILAQIPPLRRLVRT